MRRKGEEWERGLIRLSDNVDTFHGRQSDFRLLAAPNVCRGGLFSDPSPTESMGLFLALLT